MKLISYKLDDNEGIGSLELDEIVPFIDDPSLPTDMLSFLEAGESATNKAVDLCKSPKSKISLSDVKLLAPIFRPPKIIAIGLNYADHLEEVRAAGREMETPVVPMIFNKQSLSATGPYEDIHDPKVSEMLDFEGELTFVIGKKCRHVPKEKAHEVIAGYTIANDLSVRDWQLRVPTFTIGKSFDTQTTVVLSKAAAFVLNCLTDIAQVGVSTDGKILSTTRPDKSARVSSDKSSFVRLNSGAFWPTAGNSPTVSKGVPFNVTVVIKSPLI